MEVEDPRPADVLDLEDEKNDEKNGEKAGGGADDGGDDAPAEGEDDRSPWELAPPRVGGAPAVIAAFLERNAASRPLDHVVWVVRNREARSVPFLCFVGFGPKRSEEAVKISQNQEVDVERNDVAVRGEIEGVDPIGRRDLGQDRRHQTP